MLLRCSTKVLTGGIFAACTGSTASNWKDTRVDIGCRVIVLLRCCAKILAGDIFIA